MQSETLSITIGTQKPFLVLTVTVLVSTATEHRSAEWSAPRCQLFSTTVPRPTEELKRMSNLYPGRPFFCEIGLQGLFTDFSTP